MQTLHALVQRNIVRSSHTLPFLDPELRDLIDIIPSLLAEGRPSIGVYEHPTCSRREYGLLEKHLGRKPDIIVGRLHFRVMLDSLIVLVRPSRTSRFQSSITLICLARSDAPEFDLTAKLFIVSAIFKKAGVPFTWQVHRDTLPQLLVYEIMRTGMVIAGKEPVTKDDASSDAGIYIGDLPGAITRAERSPLPDWNPFQAFLDSQVDRFISRGSYPSALSIPSVNPYIIPYLSILHHYEEQGDAEGVEKVRLSLLALFASFPPTAEEMLKLGKTWKMTGPPPLTLAEALRLRKWLLPPEDNELPLFAWPPDARYREDRLELKMDEVGWFIQGMGEFRHAYPWVVLAWAAAAGLVGPATRVAAPRRLGMRHGAEDQLLGALEALRGGTEILVPHDPGQGSIRVRDGRFFFSPKPFAILEKGRKHSLELFDTVKKKTLIDDSDLKDRIKTGKGS